MGRRKTQWLDKARKLGDALYRAVPTAKVLGTGRKAMMRTAKEPSPNPNSGAGRTVTLPISARKRVLVEKWQRAMK